MPRRPSSSTARTTPIAEDPAGLEALVADLQGAPGAAAVVDPLTRPAEAGLISPDGRTVLIPVRPRRRRPTPTSP